MKFCTCIHEPQKMDLNVFGDRLTFYLEPQLGLMWCDFVWNVSTMVRQITMKLFRNISVTLSMKWKKFGDFMTLHVAPSSGGICNLPNGLWLVWKTSDISINLNCNLCLGLISQYWYAKKKDGIHGKHYTYMVKYLILTSNSTLTELDAWL